MKGILLHSGAMMWCWSFLCCPSQQPASRDDWVRAVTMSLQLPDHCGLSPFLYESLMLPGGYDHSHEEEDDSTLQADDDNVFVAFQGVPQRRPCYLADLATRLYQWSNAILSENHLFAEVEVPLVPAETLNLTESTTVILVAAPPSRPSVKSVSKWMRQAGDRGVLRVLGMRTTVGTDPRPLLPPSWKALLDAACVLHSEKSKLTVGARARLKHAHRASSRDDPFFGSMRGNDEEKNAETRQVLLKLLNDAVWINCHNFAGTEDGSPVLEIRADSGYGARWTADWSSPLPKNVEFRGFLEPQMEDGHEKRWRH